MTIENFCMAKVDDLVQVLKDTLESRGVLNEMRAMARAEIFNALEEEELTKAPLSNENVIINELIREYLEFNKLNHTLSVLLPESGQPSVPLNRAFLSQELGIVEDHASRQVPLLYCIVGRLSSMKRSATNNTSAPNITAAATSSNRPTEHSSTKDSRFTAADFGEPHEPRPLILRH